MPHGVAKNKFKNSNLGTISVRFSKYFLHKHEFRKTVRFSLINRLIFTLKGQTKWVFAVFFFFFNT